MRSVKNGNTKRQLFERLGEQVDRLARRWLSWRCEQEAKQLAATHEVQLTHFEIGPDGKYEGTYIAPGAVALAEELGTMLDEADAKNYVQMDILPHLAVTFRPIRVTVQWRDGESPAEKNARLEQEMIELKNLLAQVHSIAKEQAQDWDRFWAAMGVHSEDISTDQAIAKWKACETVVQVAQATMRARLVHALHQSECRRCQENGENGVCDAGAEFWLAKVRAIKREHDAIYALDKLEAKS